MQSLPKPARLYIKQCPKTGLKYFGMSIRKDIERYKGSGSVWRKHLKEHKVTPIHVWNSDWFYDYSIKEYALNFSRENNIDKSELWANTVYETGINFGGVVLHQKMSDADKIKYRTKISEALKLWNENNDNGFKGKSHTEEHKQKMSQTMQEKQTGSKNSQYGTMWITNGTENMKIEKGFQIPDGWYKGRVHRRVCV